MRNWRGLFVFFVLAVVLTAAFGSAFASEETGGMSYTVDFFYGDDGEYHLPGGESMLLSQLFTELGISRDAAEVTEAEFSDESLLSLTHEGTDYRLTSLQPFHTTELLRLNFNDYQNLEITVKDEIASGTFGASNSLTWSIDDSGHFILKPASGSFGTIDKTYTSPTEKGGTTRRTGNQSHSLWPWEQYKDQIKTAEIQGEVRTYGLVLPGMFEWCDNLTEVDVSGLNVSRITSTTFFFANCPKLKTINGLDKWADSVHQNTGEKVGTGAITNVASMFRNCESLEELDLSTWTSSGVMKNFQNMCNGCSSLKTFILNNPNFKTAIDAQWQPAHHVGNGVFYNCNALETVDMSNITLNAANSTNLHGLEQLFAGLDSLKTVTMKDTDFGYTVDMSDMFNDCQKLETLTFSPADPIPSFGDIRNLFAGCNNLRTLDLSNLDTSEMDYNYLLGFEDLDSLTTLTTTNSKIKVGREYVTLPTLLENVILDRDIDFIQVDADFDYTPQGYTGTEPIKTDVNGVIQLIIHDPTEDNSNPNFVSENPNPVGYLAPGVYRRTSEVKPTNIDIPLTYYVIDGMQSNLPTLEVQRNGSWEEVIPYGDQPVVVDTCGYTFRFTNGSYLIRIFTTGKTNGEWKDPTYYNADDDSFSYDEGCPIRITYPDAATSVNGSKHDLHVIIDGITFQDMSRIPNTQDLTYNNAKADFSGTEEITNPWGPTSSRPDKSKIPGGPNGNDPSRRYLISLEDGELRFWNQIVNDAAASTQQYDDYDAFTDTFLYSKGSGTDIDFKIVVDGASEDQSVLYWCDDLDMPENESWNMFDENGNLNQNPDNDVRVGVRYAPGAEGIVMGTGNDLSSIAISGNTYLKLYNYATETAKENKESSDGISSTHGFDDPSVANYLIGSKPDPETQKTRFYVKANAVNAEYRWTTGISCETTVLKSTSFKRSEYVDIHLNPTASKQLNNKIPPASENRTFKFYLDAVDATEIPYVEVDGVDIENRAPIAFPNRVEARNVLGDVNFGNLTFLVPSVSFIETEESYPKENQWGTTNYYTIYIDSDNHKFIGYREPYTYEFYYILLKEVITETEDGTVISYEEVPHYTPCTDLVKAYVFRVTEETGTQTYIAEWDKTEYYIKVVVSAPLNDAEMINGTKAEITIGTKKEGDTEITWGTPITKYGTDTAATPAVVNAGTFKNKLDSIDISVVKVWDDAGDQDCIRPESVTIQLATQTTADGQTTITPVDDKILTLPINGEWKGTFTDLLKRDENGQAITYTVIEKPFDNGKLNDDPDTGYKMTLTGSQSDGFTVTNKHNPETIEVAITKDWDDEDDRDRERPDSVFVYVMNDKNELVRNSFVYEENTSSEDPWTVVFTGLPKYRKNQDSGQREEVPYRAYELYNPALSEYVGYDAVKRDTADPYDIHWDIRNQYTPRPIYLPVTKTTEGGDGTFNFRIQLTKQETPDTNAITVTKKFIDTDGEKYNFNLSELSSYTIMQPLTLTLQSSSDGSSWSDVSVSSVWPEGAGWNAVEDQDAGNPGYASEWTYSFVITDDTLRYRVVESAAPSYLNSSNNTTVNFTAEGSNTAAVSNSSAVLTNTVSETASHSVTTEMISKTLGMSDLYFSKDAGSTAANLPTINGVELRQVNGTTDTWEFSITTSNLSGSVELVVPYGYSYEVWEVNSEGNRVNPNGSPMTGWKLFSQSGTTGTTWAMGTLPEVSFKNVKQISITVKKEWNDGDNKDGIRPQNVMVTLNANGEAVGAAVELSLRFGRNWAYTFDNLDVYDANGQRITYTVEEQTTSVITGTDGDGTYAISYNPASFEAREDATITVTNTHTPVTRELVITKIWDDEGYATNRPLVDNYLRRNLLLTVNGVKTHFTDLTAVPSQSGKYTATVNGTPVTITAPTDKSLSPWEIRVSGLPKYRYNETEGQSVIEYGITDEYVNYIAVYADNNSMENGFTITNKWNRIDIQGFKTWIDDENSGNTRPGSIIVHLHGGETIIERTITANTEEITGTPWSWKFTDLPKYDSDGAEIDYWVHEEHVENYAASEDPNNEYNIINTLSTDNVQVVVSKVWSDGDNRDGIRPTSATVYLKINGVRSTDPAHTLTLNETNHWRGTFSNLPERDEQGATITYDVEEADVTGYTTERSGSVAYGVVFTNTHTPEKVQLQITKNWDDFANTYGERPETPTRLLHAMRLIATTSSHGSVEYSLTNLSNPTGTNPYTYTATVLGFPVTITATMSGAKTSDPWNITITGLPKNRSGEVITWSINELPETYLFRLTNSSRDADTGNFNFTVTNFLNWQYIEITKTWDTDEDLTTEEARMKFLNGAELYANGSYYYHGALQQKSADETNKKWVYGIQAHENVTVTIEDLGNKVWKITVDKLPRKFAATDQTEIVWTVGESLADYDSYQSETGTANTYAVTNVEKVDIAVSKVWNDNNNQDGLRQNANVQVQLYADGTAVSGKTLDISALDGWTGTFEGLPKYKVVNGMPDRTSAIVYTVDELTNSVIKGKADTDDAAGTYKYAVTGDAASGFTIINTHTPETINITLSKVWSDDNNRDGMRATATVQLYANGVAVDGRTLTVPVTDSWTTGNVFTNLPKYQNGVEINYEIRESAITGYTTTIAAGNSIEKTYVITNTHTPETVNVSVSKIWDDENDQDGLRTKVEAKVQLFEKVGSGAEAAVDSVDPVTVGTGNDWSHTFENLPKYKTGQVGAEITYSVQETITVTDSSVTGTPYTRTVSGDMTDGFVVTNKHEPSKISVTITKEWDDNSNQDGVRRSGIAYYLEQNGTVVATYTSTNNDDFKTEGSTLTNTWSHTFEDLPEYCGGTKCVYTVTEPQTPRNYTQAYKVVGGVEDKLTIVNSHTPETVTVQGSKTWVDNDNRAGKRPGTIYIQLWKNGSLYTGSDARKTITAATEEIEGTPWSWKWEGLPKFENGREIQWSVNEENVSDYQASYPSAYNVTNTYNEGTKSISVKKVWDDDENRDGIRPTYIYVDLYADGVKTGQSKALADANNWRNTFTDLPIYKTGETGVEIVYTVKEANTVSGYTISDPVFDSTTNTFTITNTHTPATTTVQGSKTWVNRDLDPNAPESITVHLYADGVILSDKDKTITVNSKELDGTTPWSWKWEGLPKYRTGEVGKEIVYTVRETPIQGYNATYDSPNVTNTYSPGKTSYSVRKAWVDGNNQDGIRPGHVEVALLSKVGTADFSPTGQTAILVPDTATPNLWRAHTFTNLDRYTPEGQPITYSVKEIGTITGYTSSAPVLDNASGVYVITNTHTPETITITGEKVWDNDDDPSKPESVTIHLLANGTEVSGRTKTVSAETDEVDGKAWTWKWEGLPKYANGREITYTVSEDTLDDYTLAVQRTPAADGTSISFVLTNTYEPGMITVRVQKVWNDNNDQDGIRPATVEVKLIADGDSDNPVATATLPQEGTWRTRFNVPEYDGTRKIVYTVEETATDVLTGVDGAGTYAQNITGDVENGFVITNIHTPETVYIHGDKKWVGDTNAPAGTRPESVTFVLKRNNETIAYTAASAATNWKWEFPLQPRYVGGVDVSSAYEVTEMNVPNYETEIDGWIDTNEHDYTGGVTNVYTPGKTTLKVTKVWSDADNQDGIRPARVAVQLVADGTPVPERYLVLQGTGNSWSGNFNDLDIYAYGSTTPIAYTIQEVGTYEGYTSVITGNMSNGFTMTNTHSPEVVTIEGSKTWQDNDNVAGLRPDSIEITLLKNGGKYEAANITNPLTVSAEESWKWSWTNLPKFENGTEITWSVTETAVENYQTSYSGYNVTNTYDEGTTSVTVSKAWNDKNNQDGKRPSYITVALYADGVATGKTLPLGESNNFRNTFTGLPIYKEGEVGQKIRYTVKESTAIPGYRTEYSGDAETGFVIHNYYTPETVTVSGAKTWVDDDNAAGARPNSITIRLWKNNAEYASKTVYANEDWKWEWKDLPKYENGTQISWTITEDDVADYTRQVNGYNVTNTYNPGKTSVRVNKVWNDENNQDGIQPQFVRVHLYANGEDTGKSGVLTASEWTYLFEDLDKNLTYTVVEDVPAGYTAEVTGTAAAGFVVTNTHTPETVNIVVTKTWDDAGNEGNRPETVTLYLDADKVEVRKGEFTAAETAAPGWKWEITGLPKYKNGGTEISYTIREATYGEYSRSVVHSVTPKTETEPERLTLAVTNKWTPGKTSILVEKEWTDADNQDGIRPTWVLVNLLDGDGNVVASDRVTAPNWTLRFEDIDGYDASGNPIDYTVEEVYDRTVTETTDGPGTYKFGGIKPIEGGFEIKNVHTPETLTVEGRKTWDDNNNQDGKRPESITIRLMKNNVEYDHKQVTADDDWKWSWTGLPKYANGQLITWTINEDNVTDYTKVVSGYNVTNRYDPGKINIRVNKVWEDGNNQDGLRQLNVTVFLKANGETVATGVLNEASNWSYLFTNMDRNKDGKAITYTVEELHNAFITGVDGSGTYQDIVTGNADNGFTITNIHTPETVTLKGTKTWVGTELDPNAPTELKVHLFANGTEVTNQAKTVTEADGWKWEWTGLPKYANGREITYTMSEDTDYIKRVVREGDTFNVTNTYNPDEITILVRKVWNDNENQDGIRPPWTLVNLKGNGETVASEFLNEGNEWRIRIDVPQYDENQQEIKYTVEEVFTRTVTEDTDGPGTYILESITGNAKDGFTITNKHTPETVDVSGAKTWDDSDNAAGMRPSSIILRLNKNGVPYGSALTVTEADGWKWEWKNLPKYENGKEISWSINEENIEGYSKTVTGFNVTNSYTPGETVVTVRKAWNDRDNQDGLRTDHSRVYLLADGERTGDEGILIAANDWVYRFRRLPVMKDGKKIVYTVEEDPVPAGYSVSYGGDQDTALVVTNTHEPETVKIVVTKTWDDEGNENNRPETVTLYLQADGATIRNGQFTSAETAAAGWKWEIDNLPKYKNGGTAITYTIIENDSGEYSRSVERSVTPKTETEPETLNLLVTNIWTQEKTSILVQKKWTDSDNQDGIRPPWILVNLLDGDGNVVKSDRLTAENNWLLRFTDVDEFDADGEKINYSVEEVYDNVITESTDGPGTYRRIAIREVPGGFEIENGHTPETVTVKGTKSWNDEDNEAARPESITIRVLADSLEVANKEVTEADGWTWEFSDLPKYKAGKLISYTISEDAVPNYTPQINGFNVTNTYDEGVTSVSVKKVWSDENNRDGLRDWVVIKLLANGEETEHMTVLSDSNNWEHTFTNLPETDDGEPIVYTVDEERDSRMTGVDGPGTYAIDIQGDQTTGFTVNNIHTPETITITGHKTWDDNDNQNQLRPQSIFVHLHDENERLQRVEISEATNWTWTFENLPKYANGKEIQYSVHEEAVENYTPTQNGYDITNTYDPGKISVSVTKVWNDDNNRDNLRPAWILVKLLENGEETDTMAVLNERNGWKYTFTGLDAVKDGKTVYYSVTEELGGTLSTVDTETTYGYITTGSMENGYIITNKHTPASTSIVVTKVWDDGDNRDGSRPEEVIVRLYANRVQLGQNYIRPDENGNWTLKFTNLPKYENGKLISYTVDETPIEGYTTTVSGDASTGFIITNSYTPGETSLKVVKRWDDENNRDGKRPLSAKVYLLADGAEVDSIDLTANNNWTHIFTGLPLNANGQKIAYTVSEDPIEGYREPVIEGNAENGFTIINAYHPETIDIPVTKVWNDGNDQDDSRPESITVRLLADGVEAASNTLTADDNWSYVFTSMNKYRNGKEIVYTLTEDSVENYTTSIIGSASVGFTVTNSYEPGKISLAVSKRWEDTDDQDGIRPKEVTVTLMANGEPTDQVVKLNAENNWQHEFENLEEYADDAKIAYSVSEAEVDGYVTTYEGDAVTGYMIVNAHTPEKVDVRGVKVWDDNNDEAGARPESIIVRLNANEVEIASQSVYANEEGNWEWAFTGLNKYADGKEIVYTITEDAPDNYSAAISGDAKSGFTITNTYAENTTSLFVSKHWTDVYNQDGFRPQSVSVKVLADYGDGNGYVETEYSGEIKGPDWELIINDLPLMTEDGVRIKYKVSEETAPDYTAVVEGSQTTGYMITNVHEPETVDIRGEKTWDDSSDAAGQRPDYIIIRLMSDGTLLHEVRVTEEDEWKWSFSGLPKYKGGVEIKYTITEQPVDHYAPVVDGYNVTNILTEGTRSLPVNVSWDDENNQDGIRPDKVTIKLFKDGVDTGLTIDLDEDGNWGGSFEDLDICGIPMPDAETVGKVIYDEFCALQGKLPAEYTIEEVRDDVITGEDTETTYVDDDPVGSSDEGFTVTNRHTPAKIDIEGSKTWRGSGELPESITVRLLADNEEIDSRTVTAADGWSWSFTGLWKNKDGVAIDYTITEDAVEGFSTVINGYDITNSYTPGYTSLSVSKVWEDDENAAGARPDYVTVRLLANGTEKSTVNLNSGNSWRYTWKDLPVADESGTITYTVEETVVPEGYEMRIVGNMSQGYTIYNTYTAEPETITIPVRKVWLGEGEHPESVTIELLVNSAASGQTLVLDESVNWAGEFADLPVRDERGLVIRYSVRENDIPEGYIMSLSGNPQSGFVVTNSERVEPEPIEPPEFFEFEGELPETGITTISGFNRANMPASVNYLPTTMELQLPTLDIMSTIVSIEPVDGRYPVEWLGFEAGLLEGTAIPGQGISVLAAHNTLNREEYGPFASIMLMQEGDRFFINDENGDLMIFQVYANEKIGSHDYDALWNVASEYGNTVTLLTCEDERAEGGYASRRVVAARKVN